MARNTLGALIVSLGLDAANYIAGLTKAEYQAKKATDNIKKQFAGIGQDFASSFGRQLGAAFSVTAVTLWVKNVLDAAEALQDLSEETGSSVENLSRLANIAQVQGESLERFRGIIEKFSAQLGGVEGDTSQFAAAMKILGVTAKDPAIAFEQVAKALDKYADGSTKAAYAKILLGKAGVAELSTLKAVANDTEIAATRTREQIKAADDLRESLRQLSNQSQTLADALLTDVVPSLNKVITVMALASKEAGGFFNSLSIMSSNLFVDNLDETNKAIAEVEEQLAKLKRQASGPFGKINFALAGGEEGVKRFQQQLAVLGRMQAKFAQDQIQGPPVPKPQLPPAPKGGKDAKAQTDEAKQYIEALKRQLITVQDLTEAEQVWLEVADGRLKKATEGQIKEASALAAQLDAEKKRIKDAQDAKKLAEEMVKVEDDRVRATFDRIAAQMRENDQAAQTNQQLEDEISLIGKDEAAHTALAQRIIDEDIARKRLHITFLEQMDDTEAQIAGIRTEIGLLEQRKGLLARRDTARALAEEAQKTKQFYDDLGGAIASAFEEAIINGNNLRDVIKGLEQDLVRIITRKMVTEPLANSISSALQGGAGGLIAKLFGGASGGGVAGIGGFSGGGFGEHFASGGTSRGGWAMVGERGPEIVNLPKGAQVIPNSALQQKRGERTSVNIYQSFAPGTDRKTVGQAAAAAGKAVRRGLERYA